MTAVFYLRNLTAAYYTPTVDAVFIVLFFVFFLNNLFSIFTKMKMKSALIWSTPTIFSSAFFNFYHPVFLKRTQTWTYNPQVFVGQSVNGLWSESNALPPAVCARLSVDLWCSTRIRSPQPSLVDRCLSLAWPLGISYDLANPLKYTPSMQVCAG